MPGRWNIWPWSLGPSVTWNSDATAVACASVKPGPPGSARLRNAAATPQLTPAGRWTAATPEEALSTVARLAVELLGGPDVPLLKECGNPECTRIYIDRSRGMRRQWCGMESCGNRIKAAAYRARKRETRAVATA